MSNADAPARNPARSTLIAAVVLAAAAVLVYAVYAGRFFGGETAVKGALKVLRAAQVRFHRSDADADGYLEYTLRLRDLHDAARKHPAAPLINEALAACCDAGAKEDFYGYRFRALTGFVKDGTLVGFSTSPDGTGTLDGFCIAAYPARSLQPDDTLYFIRETGDAWPVKAGDAEKSPGWPGFAPERP